MAHNRRVNYYAYHLMKDLYMKEFYAYYLKEHSNRTCRRLHYVGTLCALISLIGIIYKQRTDIIYLPFICGYLPAWIGHFFFEKNRPATFKHPLKSLVCDFIMFFDMTRGKIPW